MTQISSIFVPVIEGGEGKGVSVDLVTSEPLQYSFGLALADVMADLNKGTAEIGRMAGVSPSMVSHWTTGRNTPSPDQVFAIEDGLDLEPSELSQHLGYAPLKALDKARGPRPVPRWTESIRADPDLSRNPELQQVALDHVRQLAKLAKGLRPR